MNFQLDIIRKCSFNRFLIHEFIVKIHFRTKLTQAGCLTITKLLTVQYNIRMEGDFNTIQLTIFLLLFQ